MSSENVTRTTSALAEQAACADPALTTMTFKDAPAAIDFYTKVLGFEEGFRVADETGRIANCALSFEGRLFCIQSEYPEIGMLSAETLGGSPVTLTIRVKDARDLLRKALAAGCKEILPLKESFWGELTTTIRDPFGYNVTIAQTVEVLSAAEIIERSKRVFARANAA
ncbi:MAG: VOC family protein [Pseudomonadota bacterium]